jgi:glutathione peroxidase
MNMSFRQRFLRVVYPIFMWLNKMAGRNTRHIENINKTQPIYSFYDLKAVANNGTLIDFSSFKGKKVLMVNTASDCGYTGQYAQLEKLYLEYQDKLVVIGFPANDFKRQEKGTDEEIAAFCETNYGISFPLTQKVVVAKNQEQHPIFQWLSDPSRNGWCGKAPGWNFSKYLVSEQGVLTDYFGSSVSPDDKVVLKAINSPL